MTPGTGFRVRLARDLSRYHASLRVGAEGETMLPAGRSAVFRNDHVRCSFRVEGGIPKEFDVRLADLDVVDERWTKMQDEERASRVDALQNHVKRATLVTGGRGGFQRLVIEYDNARVSDTIKRKNDAWPIMVSLRERGLLEEVKDDGRG